MPELTYRVNYQGGLDGAKKLAQACNRTTHPVLSKRGYRVVEATIGESVQLIDTLDEYIAILSEGLGTKGEVDLAMEKILGRSSADKIAQDCLAMIVNDMAIYADPIAVTMFLAVGDSRWFDEAERVRKLLEGWASACMESDCAALGGETQVLPDIIKGDSMVFAGSAYGELRQKERLMRGNIAEGDIILVVLSSGIDANGLTLARDVTTRLPDGYATRLPGGQMYGEALLEPTHLYAPLMHVLRAMLVQLHYAGVISGHAWAKLMRLPKPFHYVVEELPEPQAVFSYIQRYGEVPLRKMYRTFNMGADLYLILPRQEVERASTVIRNHGFKPFVAGHIEASTTRQVSLLPIDVIYTDGDLDIR